MFLSIGCDVSRRYKATLSEVVGKADNANYL